MKGIKLLLYGVVSAIFLLLTLSVLFDVIHQIIFPVNKKITCWDNMSLYFWTTIGMGVYVIIHKIAKKNLELIQCFSHEMSHFILAILFLRKILSFQVGVEGGVIWTSGKSNIGVVPMTLVPYCLPWMTFLLLMFRSLVLADYYWIFDVLIGITLAFHIATMKKQTRAEQPDIYTYPLWFSYLYIWCARIMNIVIILVTYWESKNFFTAICFLFENCFTKMFYIQA